MTWLKSTIIIGILIGIGVLYHLYFRTGEESSERPQFTDEEIAVKPVKVQAEPAFMGELVQYFAASGITEALQEIEVKPLLTARVESVAVREGQSVKSGQLLVQLDDQEYQIAIKEARINLLNARAEYELLRQESRALPALPEPAADTVYSTNGREESKQRYDAAKLRYQAGGISEEAFRRIEREYLGFQIWSGQKQEEIMAQKSGLAAAEAQVARAEYNLQNCRITAPFSGMVGNVTVHTGDLVSAGQTLMRLVNLNKLKLRLQVLEAELGHIRTEESVRATFAAFPDTTFAGKITGIDPVVNPETRTGAVIAEISNPQHLLKSGMFATVRIAVNRYPNRLLVPREAVVERDQRKLVFIVREGKAFWCYVETGLENDDYIEIVSSAFNLRPGEAVITEGHFALAHNAPVAVN